MIPADRFPSPRETTAHLLSTTTTTKRALVRRRAGKREPRRAARPRDVGYHVHVRGAETTRSLPGFSGRRRRGEWTTAFGIEWLQRRRTVGCDEWTSGGGAAFGAQFYRRRPLQPRDEDDASQDLRGTGRR